jgi:hypothetical protein
MSTDHTTHGQAIGRKASLRQPLQILNSSADRYGSFTRVEDAIAAIPFAAVHSIGV